MHGSFLEDHLVTLVNGAGPIAAMPLDIMPHKHNKKNKAPTLKSKVVVSGNIKGPPYKSVQREKVHAGAHQVNEGSFPLGVFVTTSKKRSSQNESDSSHGDQNFKRVKLYSSKQGDIDLGIVEINNCIGSPSRTLTANKQGMIKTFLLSGCTQVTSLIGYLFYVAKQYRHFNITTPKQATK